MSLPPPRKSKSAPPLMRLPRTERVKIVRGRGYEIHTVGGFIVGPRLDKCKALWYPEGEVKNLTLEEAKRSLAEWDKFLALQEKKK